MEGSFDRRLLLFTKLVSLLVAAVGVTVLVGWVLDVPAIKSVLPGLATMKANTAVGILTAAVALGLRANVRAGRRAALAFAAFAAANGALALVEYQTGLDLGVDQLLFRDRDTPPASFPGRMAPMTAFSLLLLGTALVLLDAPPRRGGALARPLAAVVAFANVLALISYFYGTEALYHVGLYSSVAVHTAASFVLLALGLLCARPAPGVAGLLSAPSLGGLVVRTQLAAALVFLVVVGWVRIAGEGAGLFTAPFGTALVVTLSVFCLAVLIVRTGHTVHDLDLRRRAAEALVEDQRRLLHATLVGIGDAVIATDSVGRVTFLNPVAEALTGWTAPTAAGLPLEQIFRIVNEATRRTVENPALRALREGVIVGLANHTVLIARDGTERPIEDSAAPIRDASGGFGGAVLVFRDVTERRRQERALEERDRQFRMLADSIPQLTWMAHPDGHIFWYNRRWYDYTGTTAEQMEGWGWQSAHDPDVLPQVLERWRAALATGERFEMVFPLRGKDGVFRPFLTLVVPVVGDEGRVIRWFGTNTDVSESKRVEEELRDARSRLESALAAGEIGTWEFDTVRNTVRADPNLAHMFGVSPDEARAGALDAYTRAVHPDDRDRVAGAVGRALEAGDGFEAEFRVVGPGETVRWVAARGRVERDGAGRAVRVPGVIVDVTTRKTAEDRLRESEERRRLALDSAELGAWHIDPATNTITTDERFQLICGGRVGPLSYEQTFDLIYPGDRDRVRAAVAAATRPDDPAPYAQEYRVVHPNGPVVRWVFGKGRANFAGTGERRRLVSFDGTVADITERKLLEHELRQLAADLSEADRRKDEFLATLAHELRNPLAPIRNGLQLIRLSGAGGTVEQARTMMDRQLTQLVRLVDDLLDVSRITQNKLDLRRERVDLRAVVESALETTRPAVDQAGHDLRVTVPHEPVFVDGDPTRLAQVVSNLLSNSAKYTHRGGHIWLSVGQEGETAVLSVADDGIGIPPPMLGKLFVMFTQVDRTLERTTGGLGIGLSLVKGLVEKHGGTVEARSAGEGRGSEFVVRLPVAPAAPGGAGPKKEELEGGEVSRRRILVVDDNVDAANSLAQLLELLGNEVRTANDGEAGVGEAAAFRPDVVLMDIGMPKLNGYEAARRIRAEPWGRGIVLVALTGWGQDDDRAKSSGAGFDAHLVKPVDYATLMNLLGRLVPVA